MATIFTGLVITNLSGNLGRATHFELSFTSDVLPIIGVVSKALKRKSVGESVSLGVCSC